MSLSDIIPLMKNLFLLFFLYELLMYFEMYFSIYTHSSAHFIIYVLL